MCCGSPEDSDRLLTFETMLTDPLIRMVMDSDGVSLSDMVDVLAAAREALAQREMATYRALLR